MEKNNAKHLGILIVGMATVGVKTFPTIFTKFGGRDTWIADIAAMVLLLAAVMYMVWVCKRFQQRNMFQIFQGAAGRVLGSAFFFVYLLTILLTVMQSTAVEANVMHTAFLDQDPAWAFLLFSVLAGFYVVHKKTTAVTITAMITLICISVSGTVLFLLTLKYKDFKYLFPMLEYGITPDLMISMVKLLGAYSSAAMILPFLGSLRNEKKMTKSILVGLLVTFEIQVVAMAGVLMTFNVERLQNLIYPKLTQTQLVSYFGFLEAGELFVMLQIIAGWFVQYVLSFYALLQGARQMNIKSPVLPYGVAALAFAAAYFASRNLFDMFQMLDALMYVQLVGLLLIPLVIFVLYHVRQRRQGKAPPADAAAT